MFLYLLHIMCIYLRVCVYIVYIHIKHAREHIWVDTTEYHFNKKSEPMKQKNQKNRLTCQMDGNSCAIISRSHPESLEMRKHGLLFVKTVKSAPHLRAKWGWRVAGEQRSSCPPNLVLIRMTLTYARATGIGMKRKGKTFKAEGVKHN